MVIIGITFDIYLANGNKNYYIYVMYSLKFLRMKDKFKKV